MHLVELLDQLLSDGIHVRLFDLAVEELLQLLHPRSPGVGLLLPVDLHEVCGSKPDSVPRNTIHMVNESVPWMTNCLEEGW